MSKNTSPGCLCGGAGHPLERARKQIAYLRNICADPAGFTHGGPACQSNFNPKIIAMLELIADILGRGEQVVVINARVGQSDCIAAHLKRADVPYSRIDSTSQADQHTRQSNLFKARKTMVMVMGIKCAVGHSYPDCPNEIIGSLEYSYGSLHQAKGRIDRVNSKKQATIYCVLNSMSIEETIFDVVGTKADAATICLLGQRIARSYKPVELGEVLAMNIENFSLKDNPNELDCEQRRPALIERLKKAASGFNAVKMDYQS